MKKIVLGATLGVLLVLTIVLAAAPAALAHTHIELPNGNCIDIPNNQDNPNSQSTNSHFGIGVAKGSVASPFSTFPGNLVDYPGNADAPPLAGGWC
jgi:hypothetical protein